jgi:hypothetical protein
VGPLCVLAAADDGPCLRKSAPPLLQSVFDVEHRACDSCVQAAPAPTTSPAEQSLSRAPRRASASRRQGEHEWERTRARAHVPRQQGTADKSTEGRLQRTHARADNTQHTIPGRQHGKARSHSTQSKLLRRRLSSAAAGCARVALSAQPSGRMLQPLTVSTTELPVPASSPAAPAPPAAWHDDLDNRAARARVVVRRACEGAATAGGAGLLCQ